MKLNNYNEDYCLGYQDGAQDRIDEKVPGHTPRPEESLCNSDLCYWQGHSDGFNIKDHQIYHKSWDELDHGK